MIKGYERRIAKGLYIKFAADGGAFKIMQDRVSVLIGEGLADTSHEWFS